MHCRQPRPPPPPPPPLAFSSPGILFPNVQTAEEARQNIENCYYPSASGISGTRGFGYGGCNVDGAPPDFGQTPPPLPRPFDNPCPPSPLPPPGAAFREYAAIANEKIVVGVQLEHFRAFQPDTLAAILAVKGLCFTQDGPYDHSGSHLVPGETSDPRVLEELAQYRAVRPRDERQACAVALDSRSVRVSLWTQRRLLHAPFQPRPAKRQRLWPASTWCSRRRLPFDRLPPTVRPVRDAPTPALTARPPACQREAVLTHFSLLSLRPQRLRLHCARDGHAAFAGWLRRRAGHCCRGPGPAIVLTARGRRAQSTALSPGRPVAIQVERTCNFIHRQPTLTGASKPVLPLQPRCRLMRLCLWQRSA